MRGVYVVAANINVKVRDLHNHLKAGRDQKNQRLIHSNQLVVYNPIIQNALRRSYNFQTTFSNAVIDAITNSRSSNQTLDQCHLTIKHIILVTIFT